MTLAAGQVSPAPVFLGANPACVSYAGRPVSRPLGPEEDLAWALLDAMGADGRARAVVAGHAPGDIRTGTNPRAREGIEPLGVPSAELGPGPRAVLRELVALYLDRLPAELAAREAARLDETARLDGAGLHFAWEGPLTPGTRHYYRVQGDDLLIEYDTTDEGNHAHTVLRRPRSDFGDAYYRALSRAPTSVTARTGHNERMASHVALLRGINVGGKNKVPMAELREVVTSLGHTGVTTYIQSGNVLFTTPRTPITPGWRRRWSRPSPTGSASGRPSWSCPGTIWPGSSAATLTRTSRTPSSCTWCS